jgi:hypothetical protein
MTEARLRDLSTPSAFGVEWSSKQHTYQLVCSRGTSTLMLGIRPAGTDCWTSTPVIAPERFGMSGPPRTSREFLAIAEAFVQAADMDTDGGAR